MSSSITEREQQDFEAFVAVAETLKPYLDAARSGDAPGAREIWRDNARIIGQIGGSFQSSSPDQLIAWTRKSGPSPDLKSRVVSVDVSGGAAAARVEFVDWAGFRFTDFFVFSRQTGAWQIAGKVFDAHSRNHAEGKPGGGETEAESFADDQGVAAAIDAYITHSRSGDGAKLRPYWFDHARVIGILDGAPVDRSADEFCERVTATKGAPNLAARIVSIDRSGPAASARIELSGWNGIRFTDFFVLLRTEQGWRISAKVFDAHSRSGHQ